MAVNKCSASSFCRAFYKDPVLLDHAFIKRIQFNDKG